LSEFLSAKNVDRLLSVLSQELTVAMRKCGLWNKMGNDQIFNLQHNV